MRALRGDVAAAAAGAALEHRSALGDDGGDGGAFDETPDLVDALTDISAALCAYPREERNGVLRERLAVLDAASLPSRAASLPVGLPAGARHRILAVHAAESRCFSTKERCPFLCVVEVLVLEDGADPPRTPTRGCAPCRERSAGDRSADADANANERGPASPDAKPDALADATSPLGQWQAAGDAAASPRMFTNFFGSSPARARPASPPPTPPRGADIALGLARGEAIEDIEAGASYGSVAGDRPPARSVLAPRLPRPNRKRPLPASRSSPDLRAPTNPPEEAPPPPVVFREKWAQTAARVLGAPQTAGRRSSRRLVPVIVKARDDLRQEQFAAQLLCCAAAILRDARVPVTLRTYGVVATGPDAGLIEALPDTVSLDALRRNDARYRGLLDFFRRHFGSGPALAAARTNFVESLAPACILSYLLQIKDRHNGNILLDASGRVVHIDFGYMLASSPGGNLGFEAAPFKLTADFLEVIGPDYRRFRELCVRTFLALREDRHRLVLLAEMTVSGCDHLPCFDGRPRETIDALQKRFRPKLSDRACRAFVFGLIDKSTNNWRTSLYDEYQRCCVGIL